MKEQLQNISKPILREITSQRNINKNNYSKFNYEDFFENLYKKVGSKEIQEMFEDTTISSLLEQRCKAQRTHEIVIEAGGEDEMSIALAAKLEENIKNLDWNHKSDQILQASLMTGCAISEIIWKIDEETNTVNIDNILVRSNNLFKFDESGWLYLKINDLTNNTKKLPEGKFWVVSYGKRKHEDYSGNGLGSKIWKSYIFKKMIEQYWASHLERFGSPSAIVKLPSGQFDNEDSINRAEQFISSINNNSGGVLSDNHNFELIQASIGSTDEFHVFCKYLTDQLTIAILGQTMTTENGSSYAQSKVHKEVRDEIIESDSDMIQGSFNHQVIKYFCEYNSISFPGAKPPKIRRLHSSVKDLVEYAKMLDLLDKVNIEPTKEYINMTFGNKNFTLVKKQKNSDELQVDINKQPFLGN